MMKDLFVLVKLDKGGSFERYIRKGRSNAIYSYDNIAGAKRGLAHAKNMFCESEKELIQIWKAGYFEEVR